MKRALTLLGVLSLAGCAHAPAPDAVAQVFGSDVFLRDLVPARAVDAERKSRSPEGFATWLAQAQCSGIQVAVWKAAFEDFQARNHLSPSRAEIETCARWNQRDLAKHVDARFGSVPPLRGFAAAEVGAWKRDVALYRQYGGRVIFQQSGPEPIDAWRRLVEDAEAIHRVVLADARLRSCVYEYFQLRFVDVGAEELLKAPQCLLPE